MAIQMRRGVIDYLDRAKLLPGEFAICTNGVVVACYAAGKTKDLISLDDISSDSLGTGVENMVRALIEGYIADGTISNMTIQDGSVTLAKLSAELKNYIASMQTNAENTAKDLIDALDYWKVLIVNELPETGAERTLYMIPAGDTYIIKAWNGTKWLTSGTDLSDYYTSTQVDAIKKDLETAIAQIDTSDLAKLDISVMDGQIYITNNGIVIGSGYNLAEYIDSLSHFKKEIVTELPETGAENTFYLIKEDDGTYAEYWYINGAWDVVGNTKTDLSGYYTASEVDAIVTNLRNTIAELQEKTENMVTESNEYDIGLTGDDGNILSLIENGDVKTQLTLPAGGSGSSSGVSITIKLISDSSMDCLYGDDANIVFNFSSLDSAGDPTGFATGVWYNGSTKIATQTLVQGENTFNAGPYLNSGSNSIKLVVQVEDSIGTKKWTINATNMYLEFDIDDSRPISGDLYFRHTPYGDLEKTIYFLIDGTTQLSYTTSTSGRQQAQVIHERTHGSHKVVVWATATVNGTLISTPEYIFDLMWITDGGTTSIIGSSVPDPITTKQYTAVNIPYTVYTPGSLTSEITLAINGVEVSTLEVGRTKQYWAYKSSEIGSKVLTITCGDTVKTFNVEVEDLGYSITPVTANLEFDFNPTAMAGNGELKSFTSNEHGISFSDNFDWENGGLQLDADGIQAFVVKAGTTATLDFNLFADDARKTGKNFKFIYKSTNVRNYDAVVASCYSNNIGIQYNAQQATLTSEQTTLVTPYCEDTYMETEFDIQSDSKNLREMVAWCDGKPNKVEIYSENDNYTQSNAVPFTIGSDDCDVWVYRFKAYSASLTDDEHLDNFIADAPNGEEMVSRYERNQIVNSSGEIDPDILAEICPDLRVVILSVPRFTDGKKDKVSDTIIRHILKGGRDVDNWTASSAIHCGQGTSSEYYGDSARNIDISSPNGFDLDNGTHIDLYSMTENSIGVNYFNIKLNVASSENANNSRNADDYHLFQPYIRHARSVNSMVRDTMEFHPCAVFVKDESCALFGDNKVHFYGCGDFGNSKKNHTALGMDPDNPLECIIEIDNNTSPQCRFKSDDFTSETWDGEGAIEFRYPDIKELEDSAVTTLKANAQRLWTWVVSTDTTQATDATLASSVTYGNVTYTTDSAAYRQAKFVNEFEDYFIADSALYHYLFTERYLMVDNRAKNVFIHTEDGVHWDFLFDYDNDTSCGNDNEGGLTLSYGLEDTDTIGTKSVYNASDSVLWCNIRDFMFDRLQALYINRESAGAWSAQRRIQKFLEYQNIKPERLVIADMRRKYFRPYEESGTTSYLPMMYGDKQHQRKQFEIYQERYMSSKYLGSVATADVITLRGYTPTNWSGVKPESKMKLTPYADMYIAVKAGSITSKIRAKRGVEYEVDFSAIGSLNDTEIYIYLSSMIQAIGDLSCLYVGYCNFSNAVKLETILIGSDAEGYSNTNLTEFSVGNNTMLKVLNLQNCPNLQQSISMTGCVALKTFLAEGSGITGAAFANGGVLETAHLPSPASVTLRNLNHLTDFSLESFEKLTTIRLENCSSIDSYDFITSAVNLTRLRALDIDWSLETTDTLDWLLGLQGMDENEYNTETSVLTGSVYVPSMRQSKLAAYQAAWENLSISYTSLIAQYAVTFLNYDGTQLVSKATGKPYVQYVDRGSDAYDPVEAGEVDAPTREADEQYVYTFSGSWDDSLTAIIANRTLTAVYTSAVRTYTVQWLAGVGIPLYTETFEYGASAKYPYENPTKTDEESSYIYNLFEGWDKSTGYITGDTQVFAKWQRAELPEEGKDISEMSPVEIYAVITAGKASTYFTVKDAVTIMLGHDVSYSNVEEVVLAEEMTLDGSTAIDTGISLLKEDSSWTIAVDMEYTSTTAGQVAVSCFDVDGFNGFLFKYNGGPYAQWASSGKMYGNSTYRDIAVIRHEKGSNNAYLYASNGYNAEIINMELTKSRATETDVTLSVGAQVDLEGAFSNYATGTLHWCKLWYSDLGEEECIKLASWPHETSIFEVAGFKKYRLCSDTSKYSSVSFIAQNLLERSKAMNSSSTNSGGWDASEMRTFMNSRVYPAFPEIWKQLIKQARINASEGNQSTEIIASDDWCYLPSVTEVNGNTEEPYCYEGAQISFFTSNNARIKYLKQGKGAVSNWWLRSSSASGSSAFWFVYTNGYYYDNIASGASGVCPCFSI